MSNADRKRPVANASWRVSKRTQAERNAPHEQRPWVKEEWGGITDDNLLVCILLEMPMRGAQRMSAVSKRLRRLAPLALEDELRLSPEQALAFLDAMQGKNVFLTGGAGCGKSHTLQTIKQHLGQEGFVTTASTGCAASIIGAITFHSCCGIGLGTAPAGVYIKKIRTENRAVFNRLRAMKTLIIDEVGMLNGRLFNKAGEVVGGVCRGYGGDHGALVANQSRTMPFHGVQLIVCGDFMQLPPVNVQGEGWIFNSTAWQELEFRNHVLTRVHRQSGDPDFARVLGRMRLGRATEDDLAYLRVNCAGSGHPEQTGQCDALRLYALNQPAGEHNWRRFTECLGQKSGPSLEEARFGPTPRGCDFTNTPYPINAIDRSVTDRSVTDRSVPASDAVSSRFLQCQAPARLWLCEGARVMCLKNLSDRLVNGSVGTVVSVAKHHESSVPERVAYLSIGVRFDGMLGDDLPFHHTFYSHHYDLSDEAKAANRFSILNDKQKEIAYRIQIPLRLAWATSIHKSQGMSLERVVIDFSGCFEEGQAYTALSRARTLKGANLVNLSMRCMKMVSTSARRWYETEEQQQYE